MPQQTSFLILRIRDPSGFWIPGVWNGSQAGSQTLPGLGSEGNYSFRLTITEVEVSAQASKHHPSFRGRRCVFLSTNDPVLFFDKRNWKAQSKASLFSPLFNIILRTIYP